MNNLFNRNHLDEPTITIFFNPDVSKGFELVNNKVQYYTAYHAGMSLNVYNIDNTYKTTKRSLLSLAFPNVESGIKVNDDAFLEYSGNSGVEGNLEETELFLSLLFVSGGLFYSNEKIDALIAGLETLPMEEVEFNNERCQRNRELYDFVFHKYYGSHGAMLRIYSIPKQGYIDIPV